MNNLYRSRRNILGVERATELLTPHFDDLVFAVRDGQEHYQKIPLELRAPFKKRTLANMMNDSIVHAARPRLEGHGVKVDDDHDGCFFVFGDELALRFKKLNSSGCTSNVRTHRQTRIDFHQKELEGFNRLTFVSFAYILNKLWTEISTIKVICNYGEDTLWTIPVIADLRPTLLLNPQVDAQTGGPVVRSTEIDNRKAGGGEQA
jgi:hypothetical protein